MSIYSTVRRLSDGLLGWTQSTPYPPDETQIILNMGVNVLGGVSGDYVYQELTVEEYEAINNAKPARSKLVNGVLTSATPITLNLSGGTVEADGLTQLTLSIDVQDASYAGAVKVTVTAPDGSATTETLTAIAGVAGDTISTSQVGVHQVSVETVLHGLAFVSFEGV